MRRSDDGPTEEIVMLADELVEVVDAAPQAVVPPLPPLPRPPLRRLGQAAQSMFNALVPPRGGTPEVARLQLELDRLSRQQRERSAYLSEIEKAFAQRSAELVEADHREAGLVSRVHTLAQRVAELERQLRDRGAQIEALTAAARPVEPEPEQLLRIRGIGPRYARALREHGVHSLLAIANWSDADITSMSERLEIKANRIRRERWVEQARTLTGQDRQAAAESGERHAATAPSV